MIYVSDIANYVVKPVLEKSWGVDAPRYSVAAEQLVVATFYAESNGTRLRQVKGPALSPWQIEPVTAIFLFNKYRTIFEKLHISSLDLEFLPGDLNLGALLCRLKYWSIPSPLPQANDWPAMAIYWKKYYNTEAGKGTIEGFLEKTAIVKYFYSI